MCGLILYITKISKEIENAYYVISEILITVIFLFKFFLFSLSEELITLFLINIVSIIVKN
jgi:hypothetical protein